MVILLLLIFGLVLFGGLFIGIWLLVVLVLRAIAGMSRKLNVETGPLLRESAWGSGSVNGVPARRTLRVAEYEKGWLVRIAPILGDAKLWLPKEGAEVSKIAKGDVFRPRYRTIKSGDDRVRLTGTLADFVNDTQ